MRWGHDKMKLPEIWESFSNGEWISRKAWKRTYAIQVCNIKDNDGGKYPLLIHATDGYLFKFGQIQTTGMLQKSPRNRLLCGLQYDLFASDWYVCDQTKCDMLLKEVHV